MINDKPSSIGFKTAVSTAGSGVAGPPQAPAKEKVSLSLLRKIIMTTHWSWIEMMDLLRLWLKCIRSQKEKGPC